MANPGHPYLTHRLDRQRSRQRRILRSLDDQAITAAFAYCDAAQAEEQDRPVLETELRRLADEEWATLAAVLEPLQDREPSRLLSDLLVQAGSQRQAHDPLMGIRTAAEVKRYASLDPAISQERGSDLVRFAIFLLWADELADDGYADPRAARR